MNKILIVQTAFIGDVILTTPLVTGVNQKYPSAKIDVLAIPSGAEVWKNNPVINKIFTYDKKGSERKIVELIKLIIILRKVKYDWVISPHRSLRSAMISFFSGAPQRTSFDKSTGSKIFYNEVIPYRQVHEIDRNLDLIHFNNHIKILPSIYPLPAEKEKINNLILERRIESPFIAIAPGSVWHTKRWPTDKYEALIKGLIEKGINICLIGGKEDVLLGKELSGISPLCFDFTGILNIRESYQLIKQSICLITNDSAPLHLGSASGIPTLAIFGPTVPLFGFSPYGNDRSIVVEMQGLTCRPCGIHGGDKCPLKHFNCMKQIDVDFVINKTEKILADDRITSG